MSSGYDLSSTTFSPEGRIFQIEYASKAIDSGNTCVGVKVKNGVVFGIETKRTSKLLIKDRCKHLFRINYGSGGMVSGLIPDGRQLIKRAKSESQNYKELVGERISGKTLSERLSLFVHAYTLYSSVRPFGSMIAIGSKEDEGYSMFGIEPSGTCIGYDALAFGKGKQVAKTELEKLSLEELDCVDAVKHVVRILYMSHSGGKDFDVELSWISSESSDRYEYVPQELKKEAEDLAQQYVNEILE